jgi:hypothetical protein
MRPNRHAIPAGILLAGGIVAIGTAPSPAQTGMAGAGRSLGGFGADTIGQYYSSGMTTYIPYSGGAGGYVPYQGGFAGGFGIPSVSRRLPQTPIGGISMSMTPIGGATRPVGRMFQPFGYEGAIGLESRMVGTAMTKRSGMRRAPSGLGFGYPFRLPADLSGGPSGGATMAMP